MDKEKIKGIEIIKIIAETFVRVMIFATIGGDIFYNAPEYSMFHIAIHICFLAWMLFPTMEYIDRMEKWLE